MLILHLLIISQLVPSDIIWGGQIKEDQSNLYSLEIVAITALLWFTGIVTEKIGLIKVGKFKVAINVVMWVVFLYMILNTLGNFASGVSSETLFFGPLTIVMAFCALRLAVE
jgi:hypothetical protein